MTVLSYAKKLHTVAGSEVLTALLKIKFSRDVLLPPW
jgi:hypothetical protein